MSETTTADTDVKDVEEILPPGTRLLIPLDDGPVACRVRRLKTREFLLLMDVVVSGLGPSLSQIQVDFTSGETVGRDLSAVMVLALPNAIDEFTVFLRNVVEPVDPRDAGRVGTYLADNPDLQVLLDVFEHMATQEKDDLAALAGKAQAMWSRLSSLYTPK